MSFVSECPSCGQKLKVPDNLAGKKVRCSKCAGTFVAENVTANPPPAVPPPRSSRPPNEEPEEHYDDDRREEQEAERPRRRSRRGDSGGNPGRGGMLLTFGIISIASPVLAAVINVVGTMVFAPLGFCSLIMIVVGLVMGIMAWVMSAGDLKKIRAGRIDATAQGQTKGGYITGIIGTILNTLYIVCGCILVIVVMIMGVAILGGAAAAANKQQQQQQQNPFGPQPGRPGRTFQLPLPKLSQYLPDRIAME
jgi:hypothetical protein